MQLNQDESRWQETHKYCQLILSLDFHCVHSGRHVNVDALVVDLLPPCTLAPCHLAPLHLALALALAPVLVCGPSLVPLPLFPSSIYVYV